MFTTHGIAEGEWVGNEWVQYRWSCKVKDIEVLYWMHLEDLTQLEKEGDCFQQEQPEVDLEEEMDRYFDTMEVFEHENIFEETFHKIAHHFYELGLNARKED